MILLPAILGAGAVFLSALWYLRSKDLMALRIRSIGDQQRLVLDEQAPFAQRIALPVVDQLVGLVMAVLPTAFIGRARRWLIAAGEPLTLSQFFSIVLVASTVAPGAYFAVAFVATDGSIPANALLGVPLLAAAGVIAPIMVLRRMAKNRQKTIWRAMPTAMDLLTTCVEAGLSLEFGLQRVTTRYKGPLSDEFQLVLREVALGKPRQEALLDMAERTQLPDMATFVNSIVQAGTLGTSIGPVLRTQAAQLRMRRRQRAEQMARQAPVKMVFPLALCLLPSLFIVTIGPVVLNVMQAFAENS
jgi:tight adherence protein C